MQYVSTTLQSFENEDAEQCSRDTLLDGAVYRRLDPEFYAWLRLRMGIAEKAVKAGKLPTSTFDQMRVRFNTLHAWALEHHGQAALLEAIRQLNPDKYNPPSLVKVKAHPTPVYTIQSQEHLCPDSGTWAFTVSVDSDAVKQVESIRDQAINLGWSEPRLFQNRGRFRFPCGQDYGLVCFLDDGRTIGEVTERYIEIIGPPPSRTVLRFYNPDVEQPWIRKIDPEQKESVKDTTELAA